MYYIYDKYENYCSYATLFLNQNDLLHLRLLFFIISRSKLFLFTSLFPSCSLTLYFFSIFSFIQAFQENYHCNLLTNYSLVSNETLNIQGFHINFIHSNYSFNRISIENCPEILPSKSFPSSSSSSTSSTLPSLPSQHTNRNITIIQSGCQREVALVYLVLLLGTVWIALNLLNFTKT